ALVDGELDGAIKKGDSVLVDFDGTKLVVRKSDEGKTTKLGGWALGAAALSLAGLQLNPVLAYSLLGGALAAMLAFNIFRRAAARRAGRLPAKKSRVYDWAILTGMLGAVAAPWLWGAIPVEAVLPTMVAASVALVVTMTAVGAVRRAARLVSWLARVVSRRGPPEPKPARRLSRLAKAFVIGGAVIAGATFGTIPYVASQPMQEAAYQVAQPEISMRLAGPAIQEEIAALMGANPVGRAILKDLEDAGGRTHIPPVFVAVEEAGVGAHYLALFDHIVIPLQNIKDHGWTLEDFLKSPDKQREIAREMAPTLAHELKHAAQARRSVFFPGKFKQAIETEHEAYIAGHMFIHARLMADPAAPLSGDDLYDYEEFLDGFDAYLKDVAENEIYSDNIALDAPYYEALFARHRADWPKHAAEGYRLLAKRNPAQADHYLQKAAALEQARTE
ncbi:MAG: hypothetical protein HY928_08940, partial [Elusimicrobia bacterium]|nr:hypothetical protein [Elusimicrobiota bacterium]